MQITKTYLSQKYSQVTYSILAFEGSIVLYLIDHIVRVVDSFINFIPICFFTDMNSLPNLWEIVLSERQTNILISTNHSLYSISHAECKQQVC